MKNVINCRKNEIEAAAGSEILSSSRRSVLSIGLARLRLFATKYDAVAVEQIHPTWAPVDNHSLQTNPIVKWKIEIDTCTLRTTVPTRDRLGHVFESHVHQT